MADFRTGNWLGSTVATAQGTAPSGFTLGNIYEVKAAMLDNSVSPAVVWALVLDDNHNPRAV